VNELDELWFSRLRPIAPTFKSGDTSDRIKELPHVRGKPIRAVAPKHAKVVTEWPNLAGRLEPIHEGDIVRWDRTLAPEPPSGEVHGYGTQADPELLQKMYQWFRKFVRSLEQEPGIVAATPFETARAIVLTPTGLKGGRLPPGVDPIPPRLGEFPGGVVLTLRADLWRRRSTFADDTLQLLTGSAP
jgi:hypothetical protein